MTNESKDFRISFFKPTTERAKANRNRVILLVSIWAVAVFGFHIVLRIIEKPTPEPIYESYKTAYESLNNGDFSNDALRDYANGNLYILSKVFIDNDDKELLIQQFNGAVYNLADEELKEKLLPEIKDFEKAKKELVDITDAVYMDNKVKLGQMAENLLQLDKSDARLPIMPLKLNSEHFTDLQLSDKTKSIMDKYLIHNRSVLTDFRFLGFPFHYFYSAVFLLVLFVFLCYLYCVKADRLDEELEAINK